MSFRSGFVSIIGRPNVGKSTLLNALAGQKLAIVTPKPQTTRTRIQGIVNVPRAPGRPGAQVVLVDTPGVHKPEGALNRRMMQEVHDALAGRDLVLLVADVTQKFGPGDRFTLDLVKKSGGPALLLLNKIDLVAKEQLLPLIERYRGLADWKEIIPVSALTGDGLDLLLERVVAYLPEGPHYFPQDQVTDQPERFLAAEIIREKVLLHTGQEVPYAATVVVAEYEESPKLVRMAAVIYCEREGQKAILIGRGGAMLKKVGTAARLELERLLGTKFYLELLVKVHEGWRDSRRFIEELDWRKQQ